MVSVILGSYYYADVRLCVYFLSSFILISYLMIEKEGDSSLFIGVARPMSGRMHVWERVQYQGTHSVA